MAEQKRFIYALWDNWYGENNANKTTNETTYKNSVVFIHNESGKGIEIFTQGAYFKTDVQLSDIEPLIKDYLKAGSNITITTDTNNDLVIAAEGINSLTGKKDSTELVQAKAVTSALTTPVSLTLSVADGVGTFSETFKTLNGDTTQAVTAVFKKGEHIDLTNDGGLKISHATITQAPDVKTTETLSSTDKSFDTVSYTVDNYGHVTGKTINTVTLPNTAFSDTTYTADKGITITEGNVIEHTNSVTAKTAAGGETVTLSSSDKDFKYDQFTYDGQGHITGVTERTVTLPNTAFLNDNTTYTGENAIEVAQPEEGSTQGKVTLKIDATEKVLTQSASGLKTNLAIDYVSSTNKIRLTNGTDMISEFDASAFVKDSFLKNVELVDTDGSKEGKFLKFTFVSVDTDNNPTTEVALDPIYVDIAEFFQETTVSGDTVSFTVVESTDNTDGSKNYQVKNTLGTIARNNTSNTITVSKDGLATVADIKTVLETINSDLDAVKAESADKDEIAVVTGVTQVDGKITAVDSGLAATKAYVDGKFDEVKHNTVSAPKAEGEENYATVSTEDNEDGSTNYKVVVSGIDDAIATATTTGTVVNQGTNGTYNFVKTKDGLMTAADVAALMNESWAWGTIVTA